MAIDSIRVEVKNGQKIIIHQLKAKETYYGLSKHYNVPVKNIISANDNKPLKAGDTVRIPTAAPTNAPSANVTDAALTQSAQQSAPPIKLAPQDYTEYKVGKGETLYTVAKRFIISVESIKRANNLTSDTIQEGSLLKIPHKELPPPPTTASQIVITDTTNNATTTEQAPNVPANRYGIREMTEKGIGIWIEDLNQEGGSMLALHKTAPIGTVVKITNPMTSRTTFAKVVGKFVENSETKNAIIVISKSAASLIGVLDKRFQVEIAYGAPGESNN